MNLNIWVEVRVEANVDRLMNEQMDGQKNGQKTRSLYRTMLKAGTTTKWQKEICVSSWLFGFFYI